MCLVDVLGRIALLVALPTMAVFPQQPSAPVEGPEVQEEAGARGDATDPRKARLQEDLEMLEAMLRIRESRVTEARRFLELEKDVLDTVREQRQVGASPPRQVELIAVRYAAADALLEARQSERDEIAIRLDQIRRLVGQESPEPDREERRARLDDEVRIREAQLRAREARVKAADAQVTSEENSRENFVNAVRRGIASPGAGRQAMFRVAEASTWRDTMAAERDVARSLLLRAQRRLAQFDAPDGSDPDFDRPNLDDHEDRIVALEHVIDVLRDEMYHMQWELQIFRNQQHERFGTADRFGTPPTVPGR